MCGRIVRSSPAEVLRAEFGVEPPADLRPSWNVCPGTEVLAVVRAEDGSPRMEWLRWGFVPEFAADPRSGDRAINARAETVATRPAFRRAFRRRRCLVVADGFYEWSGSGPARTPFFVRLRSGRPMGLAGLWERWEPGGSKGEATATTPPLLTCAIVTCPANSLLAPLHDRMPVILAGDARECWLDPAAPDPASVLVPCPADWLEAWPVSRRVNSPRSDGPDLVAPARAGAHASP